MNCKEIRKKLIFFIDKELSEEENVYISNHLKDCRDCSFLYNKLQNTLSVTETEKKIPVNPYFYNLRFTNYDLRFQEDKFIPSFIKILKPVYISAIFVIAIFIGINIGNSIFEKHQKNLSKQILTENTINTDNIMPADNDDELGIE